MILACIRQHVTPAAIHRSGNAVIVNPPDWSFGVFRSTTAKPDLVTEPGNHITWVIDFGRSIGLFAFDPSGTPYELHTEVRP